MKYYAVIDTNVLISGMLKKPSIPNEIIVNCLLGYITPIINEEILLEYKEVTARPKFNFPKQAVEKLLISLTKISIYQNGEPVKTEIIDPKDKIFYETVIAGRKNYNAYLITGNQKHFPKREFIITPHDMLNIINTNFL